MLRVLGSLVGFPLLAIVALFHGLGEGLRWVAMNGGYLLGFPVFAPTVGRIWNDRTKGDGIWTGLAWFYIALGGFFGLVAFVLLPTLATREFWANYQTVILVLLAGNGFSVLYELGRIYWRHMTGQSKNEAETAKVATATANKVISTSPEGLNLLEKVIDSFECNTEEANEFRKTLRDLEVRGQISVNMATLVAKEISSRETHITEAEEVMPEVPADPAPAPAPAPGSA